MFLSKLKKKQNNLVVMEEDIARGKAAAFVTHLIKPVQIQSLESALMIVKNS